MRYVIQRRGACSAACLLRFSFSPRRARWRASPRTTLQRCALLKRRAERAARAIFSQDAAAARARLFHDMPRAYQQRVFRAPRYLLPICVAGAAHRYCA